MTGKFAFKLGGLWLLFLVLLTGAAQVSAQNPPTVAPIPAPANGGRVGDYADVIDQATEDRINTKLKKLRDTTDPGIEFGVATVRTTGGEDAFDYSLKIYRGWGIGARGAGDNPGLLLFVAVDDRKYFTQVSRDLEGDLTDGEVGQIQRNVLVPAFRQNQYQQGIEATIDAYVTNIAETRGFDAAAITGATVQPRQRREAPRARQPRAQASLGTCCLLLVVGAVILFIISANGRRGGGGRGGFGGGGDLLSGLILGSVLSNMGRGGGGWSGGGFGGSGGGDWGGDGGWGGFGGGGDAGGGGAGGDW